MVQESSQIWGAYLRRFVEYCREMRLRSGSFEVLPRMVVAPEQGHNAEGSDEQEHGGGFRDIHGAHEERHRLAVVGALAHNPAVVVDGGGGLQDPEGPFRQEVVQVSHDAVGVGEGVVSPHRFVSAYDLACVVDVPGCTPSERVHRPVGVKETAIITVSAHDLAALVDCGGITHGVQQ